MKILYLGIKSSKDMLFKVHTINVRVLTEMSTHILWRRKTGGNIFSQFREQAGVN